MPPVLLHAGFHKTGTSTVQAALRLNAALLAPHLRVLLRDDLGALPVKTRHCSHSLSETQLRVVRRKAWLLFDTLDPGDPRPVLISAEELCGVLPGRHGVTDYAAAPGMLAAICAGIRLSWGTEARPRVHLTTRAPGPWLHSAWWQTLRATRLTEDEAGFAARLSGAADLAAVVARVADVLGTGQVSTAALEEASDLPLGPLDPILDQLALPPEVRAALRPAAPVNRRPAPEILSALLALNRSDLPDAEVAARKLALLRDARRK